MTPTLFEELMANALNAYRNGYPVVVFSNNHEPLHGREFLEAVVDLSTTLMAFFVGHPTLECKWVRGSA
jgi:hypothetical protein